jgi:hypothetical protein
MAVLRGDKTANNRAVLIDGKLIGEDAPVAKTCMT